MCILKASCNGCFFYGVLLQEDSEFQGITAGHVIIADWQYQHENTQGKSGIKRREFSGSTQLRFTHKVGKVHFVSFVTKY